MKRVSFSIPDELVLPLKAYAKTRGVRLSDLSRLALYSYIRRSPPRNDKLKNRLQDVF